MSLLILGVFNIYITLAGDTWIHDFFDIELGISFEFRLCILVVAFINGLGTYFYEKIAIWYISLWWKNRKEKIRAHR
jgi:hypothetical protein